MDMSEQLQHLILAPQIYSVEAFQEQTCVTMEAELQVHRGSRGQRLGGQENSKVPRLPFLLLLFLIHFKKDEQALSLSLVWILPLWIIHTLLRVGPSENRHFPPNLKGRRSSELGLWPGSLMLGEQAFCGVRYSLGSPYFSGLLSRPSCWIWGCEAKANVSHDLWDTSRKLLFRWYPYRA